MFSQPKDEEEQQTKEIFRNYYQTLFRVTQSDPNLHQELTSKYEEVKDKLTSLTPEQVKLLEEKLEADKDIASLMHLKYFQTEFFSKPRP